MAKKSQTIMFSLQDVVNGYLALKYGCAIIGSFPSQRWPSFTNLSADGSPIITVMKVAGQHETYCVNYIDGLELVNDARVTYNLFEIKEMFVKLLAGQKDKIKIKTAN